jgi:hypothetical protein
MSQVAAKVCVVCKEDCSKRPRTKDAQGRYVCEACVQKLQAKLEAQPAAEAAPSAPAVAKRSGDRQFVQQDAKTFDKPLGLEGGLADTSVRRCPACEAEMEYAGRICKSCGHDLSSLRLNKVPKDLAARMKGQLNVPAQTTCKGCGYDMRGAPSDVCPECGKKLRMPKNQSMLDSEKQARRELYRPPIILMIVGWVLTIGLLATLGSAAPEAILIAFLGWLVIVPIAMAAFWVCSLFYIEYDAPWHATALRLAGIYAAVQVPTALGTAVGIRAFGILGLGLLWLLYMKVLELELHEAIVMGIVTRVLIFGVTFGLVAAFA